MRRVIALIDPYLVLLLLLSLLALVPLAAPGYFYAAHDGRHSVFYLTMFDAALRDGALWPTWAMHHIQGYGYPTFLIQAPLGFYLGSFFVALGTGYTTAVKLTWATGFLLSGWGMYRLVCYWLAMCTEPMESPWGASDDSPNGSTTHALAEKLPADSADAGRTNLSGANKNGTIQNGSVRGIALVAALLYVFIPYHLVDIYVRAALNDTLLLAWFPWTLLAFDRLLRHGGQDWPHRLAIAILVLAGTLLTHTFALISFAPLLVTFVAFLLLHQLVTANERRWRGFVERGILAGVAGGGALFLCMAFLLPLFVEGRHLDQQVYVTNTYDFRRHFVHIGQFFSPFWGFGYSDDPTGANDGMSFQVGLLPLVLSLVGMAVPWRQSKQRWVAGYLALMSVGLLFLMTPWAQPLWEAVPALAVIQFPWRLLALVTLLITPLAGLVLHTILYADGVPQEETAQTDCLLLLAMMIVLGSAAYRAAELTPIEPWREDGRAVYAFEQEHPDMLAYTEWVQDRRFTESVMSADYAAEDYQERAGYTASLTRLSIIRGVGRVLRNDSRGASFGGTVQLDSPATVRVNLYYFPGWQVQLDGEPAAYRISEAHGLLEIDVPPGEHQIDVRMGTTTVRRIGMGVSGTTLLFVLILLVWPVGKR